MYSAYNTSMRCLQATLLTEQYCMAKHSMHVMQP